MIYILGVGSGDSSFHRMKGIDESDLKIIMYSLGDKLIHLSIEIDDKEKTVVLLRKLIDDQKDRHAEEIANYGKENDALLQKSILEYKENQNALIDTTESLIRTKNILANKVKGLLTEKQVGILMEK